MMSLPAFGYYMFSDVARGGGQSINGIVYSRDGAVTRHIFSMFT
jgi:hypothetical protein|tara:strand:+ start:298 stop:429 length:132 start_codon:yes stop_codon:yes gene_type:complete